MQDFRPLWKHLASIRSIETYHTVQYIVLQSLWKAKGDVEYATELALKKLNKAFTPITNQNKLDNGKRPLIALYKAIDEALQKANNPYGSLVGGPPELLNSTELNNYNKVLYNLYDYDKLREYFDRKYVYIFTRQDIFPEYQLVQTAHAALRLGLNMASAISEDKLKHLYDVNLDGVYFAVMGVPNEESLKMTMKHLEKVGIPYEAFEEPDIGNQITSVASYPVPVHKRDLFQEYKRLRFQK